MQAKLRVVLDTNIFINGLIAPTGAPRQLLGLWEQGRIILLTSSAFISEVERILHRDHIWEKYHLSEEQISTLLLRLKQTTESVTPLSPLSLHSRDPKDDKLLALALGRNADYLITGDNGLLVLDGEPTFANLRIITPAAFLAL